MATEAVESGDEELAVPTNRQGASEPAGHVEQEVPTAQTPQPMVTKNRQGASEPAD